MRRDALGDFLRDFGGLFRIQQVYPAGNQQVRRAAEKAAETLARLGRTVRIARLGGDVVAEERTLQEPPAALCSLLDALLESGYEGLQVDPEVGAEELVRWVEALVGEGAPAQVSPHIRVGSFHLETPVASAPGGSAAAAAGYLSLAPGVQEALGDLAAEKTAGLQRAREIVRSIAGHMAAGDGLFNPIRGLKTHDDYTFTHALNVCVITAALARALGLAEREVDRISLAALCHDIGKEKVPLHILNKDGPLTAEERVVMDRHPVLGAQTLLALHESVDPLLPIVAFQHHRGADGSGYPRRPRSGPAHPVSLLVAVADTYDALRTVRSYQKPRSAVAAVNIMLGRAREGVYEHRFLGEFIRSLGLLDVGCRVTLASGAGATITAAGGADALRPVVVSAAGEEIDLGRRPRESICQVAEAGEGVAGDATGACLSP